MKVLVFIVIMWKVKKVIVIKIIAMKHVVLSFISLKEREGGLD